mmetsp:Transcript_44180/g.132400  ORF Transcript_44180/g.132400 Transcript_44180/m.132400 type:complete len:222 (-) Transcript_44180:57-722(-)
MSRERSRLLPMRPAPQRRSSQSRADRATVARRARRSPAPSCASAQPPQAILSPSSGRRLLLRWSRRPSRDGTPRTLPRPPLSMSAATSTSTPARPAVTRAEAAPGRRRWRRLRAVSALWFALRRRAGAFEATRNAAGSARGALGVTARAAPWGPARRPVASRLRTKLTSLVSPRPVRASMYSRRAAAMPGLERGGDAGQRWGSLRREGGRSFCGARGRKRC